MVVKKKRGVRGKSLVPQKKTPQKKASGKKAGAGKQKKKDLGKELKKVFLGIAVLIAICLTLAMIADIFIFSGLRRPGQQYSKSHISQKNKNSHIRFKKNKNHISPVVEGGGDVQNIKPSMALMEKSQGAILYEIFEDLDHGQLKKKSRVSKAAGDIPRIAIIIDDIGYARRIAMDLYQLDLNFTFSVLPFSPFGASIANKLSARGAQLMLHLPMEPAQYPQVNPGPGALLSSMTPDMLLDQLRKDLKDVPGVVGVNNHMGSELTADSDKMHQIFTILKKEELFFIDSRTSPLSQGEASARLFELKFAQRDVFLDNVQTVAYITGQLESLVKIALKHGSAIGIGHPYEATLEALKIELPKLKGKIRIVPASQLVSIIE
ncbi:MAG: divergent polysaccharide deacetylase family protein [Desulfobacteraceae bacterium]|nr:divergent polysaccharide deacetylase family protein [Desulfobacteraceae bacterium]